MSRRGVHHPSLLVAGALALAAGCSSLGDASPAPPEERSDAPRTITATGDVPEEAAEVDLALRELDNTDVDVLTAQMAAGALGDREWIEIFAELRARSWLATRYPGDYDLNEIYAEEWAVDHADVLEQESLDLGIYLDEPLPVLVSVIPTRELGQLVELEVVLEAGEATIRRDGDDLAVGTLPGGRQRGLFTLGQQGPGDRWRIHSVTELTVIEHDEAGDPNP